MTDRYHFPRSTPEAQGVSSPAISGFIDAAEAGTPDLHSFMLLRHGSVVAEGWWAPYSVDLPHVLFSLSKSYTSTAIGLAVSEGRLSVDDPVTAFFPEESPEKVSENLKAMKVCHLLTMSTGHAEDTTAALFAAEDENWVRAFLACPVEYEPGTHFLYNTGATYMLSAILQTLTGTTLLDYLAPRLFEPLGIEGAAWQTCPRGINTGGFGLSVRTEDIARLGQLYLQQGMWQGQRLLASAWVQEATAIQIANGSDPDSDWNQGYGYQFWRCRHNAYRGDGAFGQYCIVLPDQDAVVAITGGVKDMQAVLNLVWEYLLPAMAPEPLPEDPTAQAALTDKLTRLALPVQSGARTSLLAEQVSGAIYALDENDLGIETLHFNFGREEDVMVARAADSEHRIAAGCGIWITGETQLIGRGPHGEAGGAPQLIATSGAWRTEDTYVIKSYLYLTPFCYTLTCRFADDSITLDREVNVAFGPTQSPQIVGRKIPGA